MPEHYDYELDTFGLACPLPIIKTKDEMKKIPEGSILKVISSDGGVIDDMKGFCRMKGHEFLSYEINLPEYIVYIKKK